LHLGQGEVARLTGRIYDNSLKSWEPTVSPAAYLLTRKFEMASAATRRIATFFSQLSDGSRQGTVITSVSCRYASSQKNEIVAERVGEIGEVSGVPQEHLQRKVLIYRPARVATQQGRYNSQAWKIRFNSVDKWENPLMGWTSTADPLSSVGDAAMSFESKEDAVHFAKKYGWEYQVIEPKEAKEKVKAYADNFKWRGPPPARND